VGTQRIQMKGILSRLVSWAPRAGTGDFYPALAALVSSEQKNVFLTIDNFNLCVPTHRPATSAGSRAGPPVS
jgi:hypothetical protein